MSDLQCAARFVVIDATGLGDVPGLVGRLARERIAGVYAAHDVAHDSAVERLAQGLGLPVDEVAGDLGFGAEGYEDLADRHRGETAVVVRTGGDPDPALLLVDADGISVQQWPSEQP
jgi:hypothetical protein